MPKRKPISKKVLVLSFGIPFVLGAAAYHCVHVLDANWRVQEIDTKFPNLLPTGAIGEKKLAGLQLIASAKYAVPSHAG